MEKLDFIDSKFRLAILAAKRAKQLVGGSRKKLDTDAENPLTIALEEIYDGKINFQILAEEKIASEKESIGVNFNVNDVGATFRLGDDSPENFLFDENEREDDDEDDEDDDKDEGDEGDEADDDDDDDDKDEGDEADDDDDDDDKDKDEEDK